MNLDLLRSPTFVDALLAFDQGIAQKTRQGGCPHCGSPSIHVANYERKPRGLPGKTSEAFNLRFSFCCPKEGCRKRTTPVSVRFLGRKFYIGACITLLSALHNGASPQTIRNLKKTFEIDHKTLKRWLRWWQMIFSTSSFYRSRKGLLCRTYEDETGIRPLIETFTGLFETQLFRFLFFISPLTSSSAPTTQYSMENFSYAENGN